MCLTVDGKLALLQAGFAVTPVEQDKETQCGLKLTPRVLTKVLLKIQLWAEFQRKTIFMPLLQMSRSAFPQICSSMVEPPSSHRQVLNMITEYDNIQGIQPL